MFIMKQQTSLKWHIYQLLGSFKQFVRNDVFESSRNSWYIQGDSEVHLRFDFWRVSSIVKWLLRHYV